MKIKIMISLLCIAAPLHAKLNRGQISALKIKYQRLMKKSTLNEKDENAACSYLEQLQEDEPLWVKMQIEDLTARGKSMRCLPKKSGERIEPVAPLPAILPGVPTPSYLPQPSAPAAEAEKEKAAIPAILPGVPTPKDLPQPKIPVTQEAEDFLKDTIAYLAGLAQESRDMEKFAQKYGLINPDGTANIDPILDELKNTQKQILEMAGKISPQKMQEARATIKPHLQTITTNVERYAELFAYLQVLARMAEESADIERMAAIYDLKKNGAVDIFALIDEVKASEDQLVALADKQPTAKKQDVLNIAQMHLKKIRDNIREYQKTRGEVPAREQKRAVEEAEIKIEKGTAREVVGERGVVTQQPEDIGTIGRGSTLQPGERASTLERGTAREIAGQQGRVVEPVAGPREEIQRGATGQPTIEQSEFQIEQREATRVPAGQSGVIRQPEGVEQMQRPTTEMSATQRSIKIEDYKNIKLTDIKKPEDLSTIAEADAEIAKLKALMTGLADQDKLNAEIALRGLENKRKRLAGQMPKTEEEMKLQHAQELAAKVKSGAINVDTLSVPDQETVIWSYVKRPIDLRTLPDQDKKILIRLFDKKAKRARAAGDAGALAEATTQLTKLEYRGKVVSVEEERKAEAKRQAELKEWEEGAKD